MSYYIHFKMINISKALPVILLGIFLSCTSSEKASKEKEGNHLIHETSKYLLQHAHNPVDWYPWGDEALQLAKQSKKLLVISIGYSSCHWCHVMERETFSDTAVSRVMNEHFVSIKVDREERPDIDNIYMNACQIANQGSCGWPLNAIALPDGRPVWVGTYLLREEWMSLLKQINALYHEDQNELEKIANQIANHLSADHRFQISDKKLEFDESRMRELHKQLMPALDMERGGKKGDIKFPLPVLIHYMMHYGFQYGDAAASKWVNTTLDGLMNGGIYDQLAGAFARYSTDPQWKVPHFEKMLYDNAQLVSLYSDAYKLKNNPAYKKLIEQTMQFMKSDFSSQDGKYYSSFDAESEGEEGKYYVWTKAEIQTALQDPALTELCCMYYGITEAGNWEKGKNVLLRATTIENLSKSLKKPVAQIAQDLETAQAKLLAARKQRPAPGRDEKVIVAWNAMMGKACLDAYTALGNATYLEEATRIAQFISTQMTTPEGTLLRTLAGDKKSKFAFLDDYAAVMDFYIRMYELSFDESWLMKSKNLAERVLQDFTDEEGVYFYYSSKADPQLISRKKEIADQVIASSNSMLCDALHKLGLYLYNEGYIRRSEHMLMGILDGPAKQDPVFYANWMRTQLDFVRPLYEVAIVGPDYQNLQRELLARYLPNAILLGGATEGTLELLKEKLQEGSTYIYVCRNKVCKLPVTKVKDALPLLK